MEFLAGFLVGVVVTLGAIGFVGWFLHEAHKPPADPRYS